MAALVDVYKTLEIYGDHGNIKKECVYTYTHTHTYMKLNHFDVQQK